MSTEVKGNKMTIIPEQSTYTPTDVSSYRLCTGLEIFVLASVRFAE